MAPMDRFLSAGWITFGLEDFSHNELVFSAAAVKEFQLEAFITLISQTVREKGRGNVKVNENKNKKNWAGGITGVLQLIPGASTLEQFSIEFTV